MIIQTEAFFKKDSISVPLSGLVAQSSLRLDPQELQFGPLKRGQSRTLTLRLSNPSPVVLDFDSIYVEEGEGAYSIAATDIIAIAAGESRSLEVEYRAISGGSIPGQIMIAATDLKQGFATVSLSGEGLLPVTVLSPVPEVGIDFDPIEVGQSRRERLTLLNRGRAELVVAAVEISGAAPSRSPSTAVQTGTWSRAPQSAAICPFRTPARAASWPRSSICV